jgi:hypothetical protein
MRSISFEAFRGVDSEGARREGTPADLLENIPYLLVLKVIPPLSVVNDLLRRGISDAGMSGGVRWEPFEIDATEWEETRRALEDAGDDRRFVEPPAEVRDYDDWHAWLFEMLYGLPAAKHRPLMRRERELADAIRQAVSAGDEEKVHELHLERIRVGNELAELMDKHVLKRPR